LRFVPLGIVALVALLALGTPLTASAQVRLFGTRGYGGATSTLVELNPATGAVIATIGTVGYGVNGLDVDPTTGTLYGATRYEDPSFNGLITINTTTGAGTPVGAVNWGQSDPLAITNITVSSTGAMYGWSEWCDCLVSIDKATGVATQIGTGVGSWQNGLSFDNADVLYMVNGDGAFYTIDTTTGVGTYQGTLGQTAHHGDFHPVSGLYYGLNWTYGTPRTLLVCDLGAGTANPLALVGDLHTLAFAGQLEGAAITKTDGQATAVPGSQVTYTIVATNYGPTAAPAAAIADTFPAALTGVSWTAVATGGATGFTAAGSGNIADTVNMPAGSSVTYTVTATIDAAASGTLSNTATIAPGVDDPYPNDDSATDTTTLVTSTDLSITKTDGVATEIPGTGIVYTIVATNAGPLDDPAASIADTFPAALTGVTYTASATGGATGFTAAGAGNIADTVSMPSGSTVTYVASATIAPAATGTLANTATVTASLTDSNAANNSAVDSDTLQPTADVSIAKGVAPEVVAAGGAVVFTIQVANAGPSQVPSATVADTFPPGFVAVSWTCAALGGATCTAAGTGDIADTVSLPPGGSVTYTATATTATGWQGDLENTATVTLPGGVTDPTTADHGAVAALQVTNPIPALGGLGLGALALLLALAGLLVARRAV